MKKLFIVMLVMFVACSTDNELKTFEDVVLDDPSMNDIERPTDVEFKTPSNGRVQTLCPAYQGWYVNYTKFSSRSGGTMDGTTKVTVFNDVSVYLPDPVQTNGAQAGTFTWEVKNTGNVPLKYLYNSTIGYLTLAVGATATFQTSWIQRACGTYPPTIVNKVFFMLGGCASSGQTIFQKELRLIGVSAGHILVGAQAVATFTIASEPGICSYP